MVSSDATMEMLQPTREMYSRGSCSSVGTGSPESCYGAKGAESLKHRNVQLSLGSAREVSQTSAPSPFPTAQPSPALNEAVACIRASVTYNCYPRSSPKALLKHSMYMVGKPLLLLYGTVCVNPGLSGAFLLLPTVIDSRASIQIRSGRLLNCISLKGS